MTVNKDRVELLCQALESGRYIQCRNRLRRTPLGLVQRWSYCALGVAIDVAVKNGLQVTFNEIENWYYLCGDHARELSAELFVNVGGNGPFDQDIRLRMFTEAPV